MNTICASQLCYGRSRLLEYNAFKIGNMNFGNHENVPFWLAHFSMHEFCFYPLTSYQVVKLLLFWFPCLPKPLVTSPRLWLQHLDQQLNFFSAFPQKFTLFASTFAINHALSHHLIFSELQFMSKEWKLSLLMFQLKLVIFCDNYDQILNYNQLPKNWQSIVISLMLTTFLKSLSFLMLA